MTPAMDPPRKVLAVLDESTTQTALRSAVSLAEAHGAALEAVLCLALPEDLALLAQLAGSDRETILAEMTARAEQRALYLLEKHAPQHSSAPHIALGKPYLSIIQHAAKTGCDFVVKASEPLLGLRSVLHASDDQHLLRKCPCPVWLQTPRAPKRPKRIIAAVDLDLADAETPETLQRLNRRVIETACLVADGSKAEIIVLHAWDAVGAGMLWAFDAQDNAKDRADDYVRAVKENRTRAMATLLQRLDAQGDLHRPRFSPLLRRGAPDQVVKEACQDLAADLVVMGTVARTGLSGVFIGNTAENIINRLECSVLAVKPDGFVSPLLGKAPEKRPSNKGSAECTTTAPTKNR